MKLSDQGISEQKAFLKEWPVERIQQMTLEEYTNLDKDTSFTYWLEKKTEHTGSIWGGSSFKFGIYRRRNLEIFYEKKMVKTDGIYAWFSKLGQTKEEAFSVIKGQIIQIVAYTLENKLEKIDEIDLGDAIKWKIAFLYNADNIIPIFNGKVLRRAAESSGIGNYKKDSISILQRYLLGKKPEEQNTLEFAKQLWDKYNFDNFYGILDKFINQAQINDFRKVGFPKTYRDLNIQLSFGIGSPARIPWIALLKEPNKVSDGIYPVYLYYKKENILILSYGISETHDSSNTWPKELITQSIDEWFISNKQYKPERYGSSYVMEVYDLNDELDPDKIQYDLDNIIEQYNTIHFEGASELHEPSADYQTKKVWLLAPGEGAVLWENFYNSNIATIGWGQVGDLSRYNSREEIIKSLNAAYPDGSKGQTNNSLALWQFSHEMKVGDIIITKRGQSEYLGYGIISEKYSFSPDAEPHKHIVRVDWKKRGSWEETVSPIVVKTLTDITKYPEYVDRLTRLIGIEREATIDSESINYYWLNANPKHWKIEDFTVGQEQSYTTHNESGRKRNRFEYFQKIKPGDLVIGYETTPIQKVVAIFEVTKGAHLDEDTGEEEISFIIQKFLPNPVSYDVLKNMRELENCEVMRNNQGSLFKLTKDEYNAIINKDVSLEITLPPYTSAEAEKELFLDLHSLHRILDLIKHKKNIIIQGPPGVGKSFIAKRLAYLMLEEKDISKVEMVQFHQSYSYEDFIQGYRPKADRSFKLENGVFFRFCQKAQADPANNYFFIIDEINRGNLSKILGEVMLLIEADKRGPEHAVSLTYSVANENKFFIPDNVHLIGTMNTADRSLAMVDYALRRRFAFINLDPLFNEKFRNELINQGIDEDIVDKIIEKITGLNIQIEKDTNLGRGFKIGHSYFCNLKSVADEEKWYNDIVKYEISPLLEEYWFDNVDKFNVEIKNLRLN